MPTLPSPNERSNDSIPDPLHQPKRAFGDVQEIKYKAELDLVDRYQLFVAELLRLSLGGLAVFGFIYEKMFNSGAEHFSAAKLMAAAGVLLLSVCAASALVFRYFATEGARYYIQALRFALIQEESSANESLQIRRQRIRICVGSKILAASSLGLGGACIAISFCLLLFSDTPK